ncbi:ankyrin repeat domain-containing protein [Achromobacter sp. NCFB-sbj8-Ac1-l]|uniref:ankyrin repeat domain-containing protein n=1 Tax=unclassified Achromobacter TaxID=2626865 RepID=UPI004046CEF1
MNGSFTQAVTKHSKRLMIASTVAAAMALLPSVSFGQSEDLSQQLYNAIGNYPYDKTSKSMADIKDLLKHGANPTGRPLSLALSEKLPDIVDLLLKQPVDVNAPIQANGETVLLATLNHIDSPVASAKDVRMVNSLIKAGANVNVIAQGRSVSPLILAAQGGNTQHPQPALVKLLLASGADAKQLVGNGFSSLTGKGASSLEVIQLLIAAGADSYVITDVGSTPLHFVCSRAFDMKGKPDPEAGKRIALLLKPGTSIDATHVQKTPHPVETPLGEAAMSDNPDCVKALIAAGAEKTAPAYSPSYIAVRPSVQGVTVQQSVLSSAKKYPDLYSPSIVKLFE